MGKTMLVFCFTVNGASLIYNIVMLTPSSPLYFIIDDLTGLGEDWTILHVWWAVESFVYIAILRGLVAWGRCATLFGAVWYQTLAAWWAVLDVKHFSTGYEQAYIAFAHFIFALMHMCLFWLLGKQRPEHDHGL